MGRNSFTHYKERVLELRKRGKTYGEIQKALDVKIPKSTLSLWCTETTFSRPQLNRIEERVRRGGEIGRAIALAMRRTRRHAYFGSLYEKNAFFREYVFADKRTAKTVLATLYLAEGSKSQRGKLTLGNSNPGIIALFMQLMRVLYDADNAKFRCTVQCRADQDIPALERFWSKVTGVPLRQFYKARIDPRSIGCVSVRRDYKAVCRVDYFSASVYNDLLVTGRVILGEKSGP